MLIAGSLAVWLLLLSLSVHFDIARYTGREVRMAAEGDPAHQARLRGQAAVTTLQGPAPYGAGPGTAAGTAAPCGLQLPNLGFDYPQLRHLKQQLHAVLCAGHPVGVVRAAYAAALAPTPAPAGAAAPADTDAALAAFLSAALGRVTGHGQLLACQEDGTLLAAAGLAPLGSAGGAAAGAPGSGQQLAGSRLLLAANMHDSGLVAPNFIAQALRLALLLPPEALAVSVYESGSSDQTRQWLALLRMLLLPLRIPANITTDGALRPAPGLGRIELLAALRNALLDPWLGPEPVPAAVAGEEPAGAFRPDRIALINDVFFCAQDVLRLAQHGAHLACGFDFYTPHWEEEEAAAGAPGGEGGGHRQLAGRGVARAHARRRRMLRRWQQQAGPQGLPRLSGPRVAELRFYDKWVARDVSGAKLSNLPPFVAHAATRAALEAGQPAAAYCCMNGLALLGAAPLRAGLRFRHALAGECRASECSLLCDDLHRLGRARVVLDPGVRLAYEFDQAAALAAVAAGGGGAAAASAGGQAPGGPGAGPAAAQAGAAASAAGEAVGAIRVDAGPVAAALGPVRAWWEVAPASARLRGGHLPTLAYEAVECCDLAPGQGSVDFARDCRRVSVLAPNFTAQAAGGWAPRPR